jgi:filamentous hemagglutinin family protein
MSKPLISREISAIAVLAILSSGGSAIAQITPDETMGNERSRVEFNDSTLDLIEGGARRGVHLFHSFEAFNVGEGQSVYFTSPSADIQNILARVTGGSRSEILGRLGTARRIGDDLFAGNGH